MAKHSLALGYLVIHTRTREGYCRHCHESVEIGTQYVANTKKVSGRRVTLAFHIRCLSDFVSEKALQRVGWPDIRLDRDGRPRTYVDPQIKIQRRRFSCRLSYLRKKLLASETASEAAKYYQAIQDTTAAMESETGSPWAPRESAYREEQKYRIEMHLGRIGYQTSKHSELLANSSTSSAGRPRKSIKPNSVSQKPLTLTVFVTESGTEVCQSCRGEKNSYLHQSACQGG